MIRLAIPAALLALAACSDAQQQKIDTALSTPAGQLFCRVQTNGGGTAVVAVVNGAMTAAAPGAAPIAIIATGASKTLVDAACAAAGPKGEPVPPPANPDAAQKVPVVVQTS